MTASTPTTPTWDPSASDAQASRHMLDALIDTHEDIVVYCGWTSYLIRSLNAAATRLLGVTKNEAMGRGFFDLMPAQFPDDYHEQLLPLRTHPEKTLERIINAQSDWTLNIKAAAMMDGVLFVIKNVSKSGESTEETNFKMLFENMSSGFVYLRSIPTADGGATKHQILGVNSAFEIYFDKEKEEAIGKYIDDIMPDFDESLLRILTKSSLTGNSYNGTYFYKNTNKHFEVRTYSPRKGFSAAVFNDIKHELEIRNDLIIKNEISKIFALGDDTSLYEVILDIVLKKTEGNGGFIGYLDQDKSVICLANKTIHNLPPQDGDHELRLPIADNGLQAALDCKDQILEKNIYGCTEILTTPVMENGKVIGIISCTTQTASFTTKAKTFVKGIADYISQLMAAEIKERLHKQELIEAKERAEQNEKLKTAFLANMSHEVRTPMNSIIGFGQLLGKSQTLTTKDRLYVEYISQACKKLLYIIENIMEMSKLQTQQNIISKSATNINSMLKTIHNEMDTFATTKHISLVAEPTRPDDESTIYTDSYKVKKTLCCLISNGIKFTNEGSVSYGYNIDGDQITFYVRDTGIGIRKELHDTIFTPFRQAENVLERKYDGVGVGLTLCKGYVDMLGGKIWLDSAPNEGSTFYFRLKCTKD